MTARILPARAYDPRAGLCLVEPIGNDFFRLIPERDPFSRLIKHRSQINWRKTT